MKNQGGLSQSLRQQRGWCSWLLASRDLRFYLLFTLLIQTSQHACAKDQDAFLLMVPSPTSRKLAIRRLNLASGYLYMYDGHGSVCFHPHQLVPGDVGA